MRSEKGKGENENKMCTAKGVGHRSNLFHLLMEPQRPRPPCGSMDRI